MVLLPSLLCLKEVVTDWTGTLQHIDIDKIQPVPTVSEIPTKRN